MANYEHTTLRGILDEDKTQFIIPFYQRNYNWSTNEVKSLIDDIIEFSEDVNQKVNARYYVGNIITKTLPSPREGRTLNRIVIVDGQQRITTMLIMIAALRDIDKNDTNVNVSGVHNPSSGISWLVTLYDGNNNEVYSFSADQQGPVSVGVNLAAPGSYYISITDGYDCCFNNEPYLLAVKK